MTKINWEAVDTWRWNSKYDVLGQLPTRQTKQAELLVHRRVGHELFTKIVVWSEQQEAQVQQMYSRLSVTPPDIEFGFHDFYFLNDDGTSAVQGTRTSSSDTPRTWENSGPEGSYNDADFGRLIQTYESEIRSDSQNQEDADDRYYW